MQHGCKNFITAKGLKWSYREGEGVSEYLSYFVGTQVNTSTYSNLQLTFP